MLITATFIQLSSQDTSTAAPELLVVVLEVLVVVAVVAVVTNF